MNMYLYKVDQKIDYLFLQSGLTEIVFHDRKYTKEIWLNMKQEGLITEDIKNKHILNNDLILNDDFKVIVPVEDIFSDKMDMLEREIIELIDSSCSEVFMLSIIDSGYSSLKFLINSQLNDNDDYYIITKINDNAEEGINNNLRSHLKNKIRNLGNHWKWELTEFDYSKTLEEVHKFYYYDDNFRINSSTGAGTLTGWITTEDAIRRANGKTLVKLNSNLRLAKR